MRLDSIKLAGFKSFVDPITIPFPSKLTAVVGPNGCGKSNIIDAVRWVMGESSAKQLRGESLDDVIFNGSTQRKPLGQASIELCFDNSDGSLGGQYSGYSEIAIRREITRDGQSNYYLNGTRCRRRDITDLFLGTGLGPRSYAIIEQGTISRVVEAKPDELRSYLEEVAGISKYKERKHETELRIGHTQENLARINDLRDEIARQLNHLQRQANAAERYQVLKQEEQLFKAQLLALRWKLLNEQLKEKTAEITEQDASLITLQNTQHELENLLKQQREEHAAAQTQTNGIQGRYYELGTEANKLEQTIQHQRERREQAQLEKTEIEKRLADLEMQLTLTTERLGTLSSEVTNQEPALQTVKAKTEQSQNVLKEAENVLREWQSHWDQFNRESSQTSQQLQVEKTRIQHLEQRLQITQQRIARLESEYQGIEFAPSDVPDLQKTLTELQQQHESGENELQELLKQIALERDHNKTISTDLDAAKNKLQTLSGQKGSLEALQKAALGEQQKQVLEWITQKNLLEKPRLAQLLQVSPGWEIAVETVLDRYLQAICLDDLSQLNINALDFPKGNLNLVATKSGESHPKASHGKATLLEKIQSNFSLASLLTGIYIAESVTEALNLLSSLAEHESVVTKEGVWLGKDWIRVVNHTDSNSGFLQRKRELAEVITHLQETEKLVSELQSQLTQGQQKLHSLEQERDAKQRSQVALIAKQAELRAEQQVQQARIAQLNERAQKIKQELHECAQQLLQDQNHLDESKQKAETISQTVEQHHQQRESLLQQKTNYQNAVDVAREQAKQDQEIVHQEALRLQAAKLQLDTTQQNQARLQHDLHELQKRRDWLTQSLQESLEPLEALSNELKQLSEQRQEVEAELNASRAQLGKIDQEIRSLESQRHASEQSLHHARESLEKLRLSAQAIEVRANTFQEQLTQSGHVLEDVIMQLPGEIEETAWEERLTQVTKRIDRLGPINLAAIEEFNEQSERKNYLDAQHADLTEALNALESAMQKMDRETRSRFKETFDQVNQTFQSLFPHLFGGGRASLELVGDDLLSAGVTVMAQPPGKRNSTIHLLSGGEKALTAISLVFSLFQLNPAPFCMLDEVDAPLDDANVVRFCNLVKEMSSKVQFIFISHNKLAIEMADHLAGVTMQEAGVSRLVSVDVEEAIAMAGA